MASFKSYLDKLGDALDAIDHASFDRMVNELRRVQVEDKFVYVCGNDGSAASASHMILQHAMIEVLKETLVDAVTP